ncbi:MAG TPA: hypothetical protein VFV93_11360 [Thermomicrobiales bacterium]|nr:hypothetical protein [Thermomicrobiales bacterium]
MTTMATLDWAMQALGISIVPAGRSEAPACTIGLDGRSIDAEVIVIAAAPDIQRPIVVASIQPTDVRLVMLERDAPDNVCPPVEHAQGRSDVIHVAHGLTATGDWFLLADLCEAVACREPPAGDIITANARDN